MHLSLSVFSALATIVTVQAQANTGPVNLPINAQNGHLHFPLQCSVIGIPQVFDGIFTGTGPVLAGPGQDVYLTEFNAKITVPSNLLYDFVELFGVTQASAVVTGNFSGVGTAEPVFPIFPGGLEIKNISIPFGKDIVVNIPADGGVLPPVGPVTMGTTPGTAIISFQSFSIALSVQDKNGKTVLSNLPITCGQPVPNVQLYVIGITGAAGQAPLLIEPGPGQFPDVSENMLVGSYRFPYSCNFEGIGTYDIDLALTGTLPTYLSPGGTFYIQNSTAFLRLPNSVATGVAGKYPNLAKIDTIVNSFFVTTTNTNSPNTNAIPTPIDTPLIGVDGGFALAVPPQGVLPPIGPIVASGTSGLVVAIGTGIAQTNVLISDSTGAQIGNVSVTCSPSTTIEYIGLEISATKPPTFTG